jgi:hypothetical protein
VADSTKWLIGIAVAIGVIVVASVIVAVTLDDTETEFEPGTPEATVQAYFRAVQDRDVEAAFGQFTGELAARCLAEDFRRATFETDISVRIRETRIRDSVAEIEVRVAIRGGESPFGDGYDTEELIVLEQEDGEWRISEPPWPLWWCPPVATPSAPAARR